jgi:hypothetical protein
MSSFLHLARMLYICARSQHQGRKTKMAGKTDNGLIIFAAIKTKTSREEEEEEHTTKPVVQQ